MVMNVPLIVQTKIKCNFGAHDRQFNSTENFSAITWLNER